VIAILEPNPPIGRFGRADIEENTCVADLGADGSMNFH